jgi:hypothetical protein
MHVGVRMKAQLFQLGDVLVLPLELVSLRLLILEFSQIHDLAHRRCGVGDNLDEIEPALSRCLYRFCRRHDPHLSGIVDDANLGGSDFFVYAYALSSFDGSSPGVW